MKTKVVAVLLVLNALLLGFGFVYFKRMSARNDSGSDAPPRVNIEKLRSKPSPEKRPVIAQTNVVYVTNQFHWREVESADYREYIAKLRSVGCPEATIKDIIITDIMRLYAARRGQFYHNGREFHFWETDEKRKLKVSQLEEREKQLASIDKEIPGVLRDLLGINYEREINKYFIDSNEDERRLNFVSEEKRGQLLALRDEIEGLREKILDRAGDNLSDADRAELKRIEELKQTRLAGILTPSELEQFELRTSETADRLRAELVGFNPSETEFRDIYQLQKMLDDRFAYADVSNDATAQQKAQTEQQLMTELRAILGETRFADYQRAKNPEYRNAFLFSEVYELPPSTAQSIFDIQQIAQRERNTLLSEQRIPEETRLAALKAIQDETEKSLLRILGTKMLGTYSQSSGQWVKQLGSPN